MANYTENYQLHQWEANDDFLREDFNTDFAKIDAALGNVTGAVRIATGSYVGDGTEDRYIGLDCTPRAVILFTRYILSNSTNVSSMVVMTPEFSYSVASTVNSTTNAAIEGNGFRLTAKAMNISGETNRYLVFY